MKKFLFATVALLVAVGMAAPVMAEDRLSLSGSMQVRGYYYDADDNGAEDSGAWNDSRLRIAGKIAVADGVSVNFRMDAVESGENSSDATAFGFNPQSAAATQYAQRRGDIQFDKAYLQFDKAGYTVMAGQQYFRSGIGTMLDVVGAGFVVKRGALKFSHVKVSDKNEGNDSFDKSGQPEASLTSVQYAIKSGDAAITPILTYSAIEGDGDIMGLGVNASANLGGVGIKGELNYFDGEDATATTDLVGLQLFVDASMAASDTVTVGGHFIYAAGSDDAGEQVITNMNTAYNVAPGTVDYTFADFSPFTYGFNTTDFVAELDAFSIDDNAGIIALQLYSDVKFSDDLKGKFAVAFAQAEEDAVYDSEAMAVNASFAYALAANTTLTASLNFIDYEDSNANDEQDALQAISGLYVKF